MSGGHRHAVFRDEKTGNGTNENGTSSFPFHQHADLVYKQLRTVVLLRANGEVSVFVFTLLVYFDSDCLRSTRIFFARTFVQTTAFVNRVIRPGGVCVCNAMKSRRSPLIERSVPIKTHAENGRRVSCVFCNKYVSSGATKKTHATALG